MIIIHVADYGQIGEQNGITTVLDNLILEQRALGHQVYFFNINNNGKIHTSHYNKVVSSIKSFNKNLNSVNPDIVIFHSLYYMKYILYMGIVYRKKIPYLIEFHGGATNFAQSKNLWKKSVANKFFFDSLIKKSNGLIFLTDQELKASETFSHLAPNIIIPNGCTIPHVPGHVNQINQPLICLFLGRIDIYYKGLDVLVEAVKKVYDKIKGKIIFQFYGSGELEDFKALIGSYQDILKLNSAVYGDSKSQVFSSADIFVLTSRSEGMPMSVLEALAFGLPCLITEQTNMSKFVKNGAGWVTECNVDAISESILEIVNSSNETIFEMSKQAQKNVLPYSWNKIAQLSIEKYEEVLKN